jgi:hypothetical protein
MATAAVAYFPAQRLSFDRSIENMFAPDDPILEPYRQLKRTFGGNEVALAAYVDPQLLTPEGMDRLETLTNELTKVPGVANVFSLSTSPLFGKRIISTPLREPFLKLSEGYISADGQTRASCACCGPSTTRRSRGPKPWTRCDALSLRTRRAACSRANR